MSSAQKAAEAEGRPAFPMLPPAFLALHNPRCLGFVRDMYDALDAVEWQTCVVCWRAWFSAPTGFSFQPPAGARNRARSWFNFHESTVLRATCRKEVDRWYMRAAASPDSVSSAHAFLQHNYDPACVKEILGRLEEPSQKRTPIVCTACSPHVENDRLCCAGSVRLCDYVIDPLFSADICEALPVVSERWHVHAKAEAPQLDGERARTVVLGRAIQDFAPAVAQLTDQEEMVLCLVHPLVQVFSLPRTGQLAYVGHVCNFRQQVATFFKTLPILPADMPFVMVRPRAFRNKVSNKKPFKVDVNKLRAAYAWLKQHNGYYRDIDWNESAAAAWSADSVEVGTTREEDLLGDQPLAVSREEFDLWVQETEKRQDPKDAGFSMGRRILELLARQQEDPCSNGRWSLIRALAADLQGQSFCRAALSLPENTIAAVMHAHGALHIDVPAQVEHASLPSFVASIPQTEWSEELSLLYSELHTVRALLAADEPPISLGGFASAPPGEDVGQREELLEGMAAAIHELQASTSDLQPQASSSEPLNAPVADSAGHNQESKLKFPRVEPPVVEDEPGQAIREDTPGYIAQAFPKLFPYGTGDFHTLRCGMAKLLKFEEWGRFVLLWHDGRFIRHTRFRYWLLDTVLRTMTPGMQRTFFKTRSVATQYTLEDLLDQKTRKNLVQQMSTATNRLPGSVGERRKMRQELESLVHQLEAETADANENAGAGRIPAGFCTLTCSVYKWHQLHETLLKSYPSGDASDPQYREYYQSWMGEPPGPARGVAMKKAFYELANANPGAVAWYCGIKLEMAVHLVANVLTETLQDPTMPGLQTVRGRMEELLRSKVGEGIDVDQLPDLQHLGEVDDFYASFEWSDGGLVHVHIAMWIVGSPRIDKVIVPKERGDNIVEIEVPIHGETVLPQEEAATLLSSFWERAYCEFNVAKTYPGDSEPFDRAGQTGPRLNMGRALERESPSPESLSYAAMSHCLLGGSTSIDSEREQQCWQELEHILSACGRGGRPAGDALSEGPSSASPSEKRASARNLFVASLAEWVGMHDLHKPFPLGPPAKGQPCCAVDHEHSTMEKLSCNKLFPRKCIRPGQEEIIEDPRRRGLFRLWLARNCNFINNYVPIVALGMLSNMDFQATLTKDAVIEYMTKYMTKAGQGSLVQVMEHSFATCIEKARDQQQGSGAAILKWFNLQSITEVKSQLETMHLLFGVPRFICTRGFTDLWLQSEVRVARSADQIRQCVSAQEPIACRSAMEVYANRHSWQVPTRTALLQGHPTVRQPWWREILRLVRSPVSDSDVLDQRHEDVTKAWPTYLQLMSLWQLKRFFRRSGNSLVCRPRADVVVVHPSCRFTIAGTDAQWKDVCFWTLLAYCNHGPTCDATFRDLRHLEGMEQCEIEERMRVFVTATPQERHTKILTACPPHIRKSWLLGCARRERAEARKAPTATVTAALRPRFVFEEEAPSWKECHTMDMSAEDVRAASAAWHEAEELEKASWEEGMDASSEAGVADRLCHPSAEAGGTDKLSHPSGEAGVADRLCHPSLDVAARKRMAHFMQVRLKWTHRELHDAAIVAGLNIPATPSLVNYFGVLHASFGNTQTGFMPQAFRTHTKKIIQALLKCFSRTGLKLGGKLADSKGVLTERLAHWLNQVIEAGRAADEVEGGSSDASDMEGREAGAPKMRREKWLLPEQQQMGEVPPDAIVTAEQAESALGRAQGTEFDEDLFETIDLELRQEEEALAGRHINPSGVDYSCLCHDLPDSVSAAAFGWDATKAVPRLLTRQDFALTGVAMQSRLQQSLQALYAAFEDSWRSEQGDVTGSLDPTQLVSYQLIEEWAVKRQVWIQSQSLTAPPSLRLLLLGTAGTGKTHTAKLAIARARRVFGSFHSVLTVAYSGVAAANLGDGARTVDSVFHTNTEHAMDDRTGEALDKLVGLLRDVQLLVIDEVSTLGAAQFEIMSRRLEQVGKVLWRARYGHAAPDSLNGFGGVGVLLIGDFAQLPPVRSSSLLAGASIDDPKTGGMRALALTGRQTFQTFEHVVRLRRIHRLLGADPFKESTLRLRDAAITVDDYSLWKEHEIASLEGDGNERAWPGGEDLLRTALVLVADNAQAGRINGKRLAEGAPLCAQPTPCPQKPGATGSPQMPGAASIHGVVVRCAARHNSDRGHARDASEFRNLRTATHLKVGAKVILTTNRIWEADTVPLGLMNGARGTVVAIAFAPPGAQRVDGVDLAGTGFPQADGAAFPRALDQCPLPDFVVVHFPGYRGLPLFSGLPPTWVPIPCIEQRSTRKRTLCRAGLPLKLAWALTIHKSQGITEPNGIIVSFAGTRMPRAVSRMGLAFVAWTRSTSWVRTAFQALPPIQDFLAARFSKEFTARSSFETRADSLHDCTLEARMLCERSQIEAHQQHLRRKLQLEHRREASAAELADIADMLCRRGVAPVSDSALCLGEGKSDARAGGGLWSIVASFRADRTTSTQPRGSKKKGESSGKLSGLQSATDVVRSILQEHRYTQEHIERSLSIYGPDLQSCIDYCLQPDGKGPDDNSQSLARQEDWASSVILRLGFDAEAVTQALEVQNFSFPRALALLLFGNDPTRSEQVGPSRFRRHTSKRVYGIAHNAVAGDPVRGAYETRARQDLNMQVRAIDLGQYAGETTAACFWLSVAAALAHTHWTPPAQALPGFAEATSLLAQVTATPVEDLDVGCTNRHLHNAAIGLLAAALRRHMCEGPGAAMLRGETLNMVFPAFAALGHGQGSRELHHYKAWVHKLATKEYADELVVLATAHELNVEITCVPFTPYNSPRPWTISKYAPPASSGMQLPRVLLGNNDVHFMWLAPVMAQALPGPELSQ